MSRIKGYKVKQSNAQPTLSIDNLGRGEFGIVEEREKYVLEKRQDPANGLTYYVVYDKDRTYLWSDEDKPWDFRRAVRIFGELIEGKIPKAKQEKFSFL